MVVDAHESAPVPRSGSVARTRIQSHFVGSHASFGLVEPWCERDFVQEQTDCPGGIDAGKHPRLAVSHRDAQRNVRGQFAQPVSSLNRSLIGLEQRTSRDDDGDGALLRRTCGQESRACVSDALASVGGIHHARPPSFQPTNDALPRLLMEGPAGNCLAVGVSEYATRLTPDAGRTFAEDLPGATGDANHTHLILGQLKGTPWNV